MSNPKPSIPAAYIQVSKLLPVCIDIPGALILIRIGHRSSTPTTLNISKTMCDSTPIPRYGLNTKHNAANNAL